MSSAFRGKPLHRRGGRVGISGPAERPLCRRGNQGRKSTAMKRFLFINGLVALVAAATIGIAAGGTAHALYYCNSNISGMTINDSVVVPNGAHCSSFGNTHISGNVTVQPGGTLTFDSTTPSSITVGGSIYLKGVANQSQLCGTTTSGSVYIQNNANEVDLGGGFCGAGTPNNIVKGTVYVQYNTAPVMVENNQINQGTYIQHNSGFVTFSGNTVGTSVTATGNTGGGSITNNTIGGSLTANQNNPAYTVSGNTVKGICTNQATPHFC